MNNTNLTTLESRVLDALYENAICTADVAYMSDDDRQFKNYSDASTWATENGLTHIASDEEIIQTIERLHRHGLVSRAPSRRGSSYWYALTDDANARVSIARLAY